MVCCVVSNKNALTGQEGIVVSVSWECKYSSVCHGIEVGDAVSLPSILSFLTCECGSKDKVVKILYLVAVVYNLKERIFDVILFATGIVNGLEDKC